MAIPLTANQALIHLCSSVENLLIPLRLQQYGCSAAEALEIYGVFSGMAISVVFFPGVLTNSLSVLLLPSISQAKAENRGKAIRRTVTLSIYGGLALGFLFTFLFLMTGDFIGNVIFGNALAGELIRRLSWICPLMYVYSLISGVLHGLGAAKQVFFINLLSSGIRIGILCLLVPLYGISAILWGMLLSQLFSALAAIFLVEQHLSHDNLCA
jgi:stage V sporulation protein B